MIVATAGHVDHGKTSLVKQITGIDTDRLDEEKKRGKGSEGRARGERGERREESERSEKRRERDV